MDFNNVGFAIKWILFLGLFPMAFIWLRRAYKIFIKKDYSEVALKRGEGPANPEKWAPYTGIVNLAAGGTALYTVLGIFVWIATGIKIGPFVHFDEWSKIAGITLWMKIFADYIVSRQAHPFLTGRKKKEAAGKQPPFS